MHQLQQQKKEKKKKGRGSSSQRNAGHKYPYIHRCSRHKWLVPAPGKKSQEGTLHLFRWHSGIGELCANEGSFKVVMCRYTAVFPVIEANAETPV